MIQGQYHRPPCCRRSCWPFLTRCRALKGCMSCRYITNPGCTQSIPTLQKWRYHPNSRMNRFSAISSEISFTAMSTFPSLFHRCHGSSWHQTVSKKSLRFLCFFFCGRKSARGSLPSSKCLKRNNTHPNKKCQVLEGALAAVREVQKSQAQLQRLMTSRVFLRWTFSRPSSKRGLFMLILGSKHHTFNTIPSNCGT